ncbi:MAG TPA: lysophospholipid acyltransferase family protein [Solirubrobacterales bacterium]|nr:lysophospholipid acyltransferase family protein [Solirubrobacterales bacterium]
MLYGILKPVTRALMRLLFRLEGHGTEHIPAAGSVLIVSNHSSVLDPPLIGSVCPRQLTFLAKAELFRIPGFGWLIRRLGARPLRREGADPSALRMAQRVLGEGRALLVFPEGTRGEEGVLREAKAGAALLAVQSGATVIPAYVRGSGRAWPRGRRLPRPAKVVVTFGAPLRFQRASGADRRAQYETASRQMMAAIAELRDRATGGVGAAGARRPLQIH